MTPNRLLLCDDTTSTRNVDGRTDLDTHPKLMVEVNGFEPMTPCLQSRCSPS
jgi:hypothetical protein